MADDDLADLSFSIYIWLSAVYLHKQIVCSYLLVFFFPLIFLMCKGLLDDNNWSSNPSKVFNKASTVSHKFKKSLHIFISKRIRQCRLFGIWLDSIL